MNIMKEWYIVADSGFEVHHEGKPSGSFQMPGPVDQRAMENCPVHWVAKQPRTSINFVNSKSYPSNSIYLRSWLN